MPPVSLIFLAATVTLRVYGVHSRLCLPDAIPEFERQNVPQQKIAREDT
jgi:hypothetical protein